jgi:hypothetical protein
VVRAAKQFEENKAAQTKRQTDKSSPATVKSGK